MDQTERPLAHAAVIALGELLADGHRSEAVEMVLALRREAYRQAAENMREWAAKECEEKAKDYASREPVTDIVDCWTVRSHGADDCADAIRALPVETGANRDKEGQGHKGQKGCGE